MDQNVYILNNPGETKSFFVQTLAYIEYLTKIAASCDTDQIKSYAHMAGVVLVIIGLSMMWKEWSAGSVMRRSKRE